MGHRRVYFGLGSNLGSRWSHLARAVETLRAIDPGLVLSSVYETAPVGGPEQGPYLNAVVSLVTDDDPDALLGLVARLEVAAERVRREHWGPRTLDVDVLIVDGVVREDPRLTLPHPRTFARAFVLAPLEEIAPDRVPANWREDFGGEGAVVAAVRRVGAIVAGNAEP